MPAGRPTTYNAKIQKMAEVYLEIWKDDSVIPSIASLALYLGVPRPTLYEWKEKHDKFKHVIETVLATQEVEALNKGLEGKFTPTISKLVLAHHGYHDKVDTDVTDRRLVKTIRKRYDGKDNS